MTGEIKQLEIIHTGTVSIAEFLLWVVIALLACLFGATAIYNGLVKNVVFAGCLVSAIWGIQLLGTGLLKRIFSRNLLPGTESGGRVLIAKKSSEHAFLKARDALLYWSLFIIISAWFLSLTAPALLVWLIKAICSVCILMCIKEIGRGIIYMAFGKCVNAELKLCQLDQDLKIQIDIHKVIGVEAFTASLEVIEIPQDQVPEYGLSGKVIQELAGKEIKTSESSLRFEFELLNGAILNLINQPTGLWLFSDASKGNFVLIRLKVVSIKNIHSFDWR